jgi:hypothetical protein
VALGLVAVISMPLDAVARPVLVGPREAFDYSAVPGYASWVEAPRSRETYELIVEDHAGNRWTVLEGRRVGVGTDLGLDTTLGDVLVFTRTPFRSDADLGAWSLTSHRFVRLPDGINSDVPEYGAEISGDHLLFGRDPRNNGTAQQVLIGDLTTGRTEVLARGSYLTADSTNGDWATYSVCGERTCDVYRYRVSTGRARRIPGDLAQYASTVLPDGTVYLARSRYGHGCGGGVAIVRWTPEGTRTVKRFPGRYDIGNLDALEHGDGVALYVERVSCTERLAYDIVRVNV